MNVVVALPDAEPLGKASSRPSQARGGELAEGFEKMMKAAGQARTPARNSAADEDDAGPRTAEQEKAEVGKGEFAAPGAPDPAANALQPMSLAAILSTKPLGSADAPASRPKMPEPASGHLDAGAARARSGTAGTASGAADADSFGGAAFTAAGESATVEATARFGLSAVADGDGRSPAAQRRTALETTKVDFVHMRTHFEPHRRDPDMVASRKTAADDVLGSLRRLDASLGSGAIAAEAVVGARIAAGGAPGTADEKRTPRSQPGADQDRFPGKEAQQAVTSALRAEASVIASPVRQAAAAEAAFEKASDKRAARLDGDADQLRPTSREAQQAATPAPRTEVLLPASPTGQVAAAVLADLGSPVPPAVPRQAGAESLRYRAGGAALKSIQIQLQPEHLGTVDVTMKLVRGELAIELATNQAETAQLLREDAEGLKELLRKAGFSVEDAAITVVARDHAPTRVATGEPLAASTGDGSFERSAGGPREDGSGSQRGFGERGGGERGPAPDREAELRRPSDPSVYL